MPAEAHAQVTGHDARVTIGAQLIISERSVDRGGPDREDYRA
jgi:hypothetical protein